MQVLYRRCAGLDVHKKTVVACRMVTLESGAVEKELRTFGTTTGELLQLLDWLLAIGCTHAVIESTGEYWKPVYNLLEGHLELLLVNAHHVHALPGRKTDIKDAEWLADLLRHGLLRGSFIPPRPQRELRDLTRQRSNLVQERAAVVNRLQKVLEDANVKLASVVTDVMGVSARAMLAALIAGERDTGVLAELARGRLRSKRAELEAALTGRVRAHHCFLLSQHLMHTDFLEEQIERFEQAIAQQLAVMDPPASEPVPPAGDGVTVAADAASAAGGEGPRPAAEGEGSAKPLTYAEALALLDTIPGVNRKVAQVWVAEAGIDMNRFPSERHLAAWTGVAPGNNESAGKQRSGRTRPGNANLRTTLIQAAHAAAHTQGTYLAALYRRILVRRGKKRAMVAVAHAIVVSAYYMLVRQVPYQELGNSYLNERQRESVVNRLVHRLKQCGYQVALEPVAGAARG